MERKQKRKKKKERERERVTYMFEHLELNFSVGRFPEVLLEKVVSKIALFPVLARWLERVFRLNTSKYYDVQDGAILEYWQGWGKVLQ